MSQYRTLRCIPGPRSTLSCPNWGQNSQTEFTCKSHLRPDSDKTTPRLFFSLCFLIHNCVVVTFSERKTTQAQVSDKAEGIWPSCVRHSSLRLLNASFPFSSWISSRIPSIYCWLLNNMGLNHLYAYFFPINIVTVFSFYISLSELKVGESMCLERGHKMWNSKNPEPSPDSIHTVSCPWVIHSSIHLFQRQR